MASRKSDVPRRLSIIKESKPGTDTIQTPGKTQTVPRRVSFASNSSVKPFINDGVGTIWDSTYEEEIKQCSSERDMSITCQFNYDRIRLRNETIRQSMNMSLTCIQADDGDSILANITSCKDMEETCRDCNHQLVVREDNQEKMSFTCQEISNSSQKENIPPRANEIERIGNVSTLVESHKKENQWDVVGPNLSTMDEGEKVAINQKEYYSPLSSFSDDMDITPLQQSGITNVNKKIEIFTESTICEANPNNFHVYNEEASIIPMNENGNGKKHVELKIYEDAPSTMHQKQQTIKDDNVPSVVKGRDVFKPLSPRKTRTVNDEPMELCEEPIKIRAEVAGRHSPGSTVRNGEVIQTIFSSGAAPTNDEIDTNVVSQVSSISREAVHIQSPLHKKMKMNSLLKSSPVKQHLIVPQIKVSSPDLIPIYIDLPTESPQKVPETSDNEGELAPNANESIMLIDEQSVLFNSVNEDTDTTTTDSEIFFKEMESSTLNLDHQHNQLAVKSKQSQSITVDIVEKIEEPSPTYQPRLINLQEHQSLIQESRELTKAIRKYFAEYRPSVLTLPPRKLYNFSEISSTPNTTMDFMEESSNEIQMVNTLHEKIVEFCNNCQDDILHMEKHESDCLYVFSTYRAVWFKVKLNAESGLVKQVVALSGLDETSPDLLNVELAKFTCHYLLNKLKFNNACLYLGSSFDILSFLEYIHMTTEKCLDFNREYIFNVNRHYRTVKIDEEGTITFKLTHEEIPLWWSFSVKLLSMESFVETSLKVTSKWSPIKEEDFRDLLRNIESGVTCVRRFLEAVQEYFIRTEVIKHRFKERGIVLEERLI